MTTSTIDTGTEGQAMRLKPRHSLWKRLLVGIASLLIAAMGQVWVVQLTGSLERQQIQAAAIVDDAQRADTVASAQARIRFLKIVQILCLLVLIGTAAFLLLAGRRVLVGKVSSTLRAHGDPGDVASAENEIDALLNHHDALLRRVQSIELENVQLRRLAGARHVIPEQATDMLQRACVTLARSAPGEKLLRTLLADLNHVLGVTRIALAINPEPWQQTALESAVVVPESPRLLHEQSLADLMKNPGVHLREAKPGEPHPFAALSLLLSDRERSYAVLIAELDGEQPFEPWQIQLARIFADILTLALAVFAVRERDSRLLLLEERTAIARELNDSLARSLSFTRLQLGRLKSLATRIGSRGSEELSHVVEEVRTGVDKANAELREVLSAFRTSIHPAGLSASLAQLLEDFSSRSAVTFTVDNRISNFELSVNQELHVLQIVREALNNAVHARASKAHIRVTRDADGAVTVGIEDNGPGIEPLNGRSQYDLSIMRERAQTLGGTVELGKLPDGGTSVALRFRSA